MTILLKGSDKSEITLTATRITKSGDTLTIELNQGIIEPEPSKDLTFDVMEGTKSYGSWKASSYQWTRDDKGFQSHILYMMKSVAVPGSIV